MLNSRSSTNYCSPSFFALVVMLLFLCSCLPSATQPSLTNLNNSAGTPTTTNGSTTNYGEPAYPLAGVFVQEGSLQSTDHLSLPLNFNDSFLIRGLEVSKFLRTVSVNTRLCIVANYTYSPGYSRYLLLSARSKSYTDLTKKTTEFYLYIEPNNDSANQNDCLTPEHLTLYSGPTKSLHFSLTQLCADCNTTVTSEGFLLNMNGNQVPNLNLSLLNLTIAGSTAVSGNSCSESTLCQSRGFSCCLEGSCVMDSAVRPGAILLPGFSTAQADVQSNPDRFVLYPQYYFVCASRPTSSNGTGTNDNPIDPNYDSQVRLMELNNLYQCLSRSEGEFSYCTVKFTNATTKLNQDISSADFTAGGAPLTGDLNFSSLGIMGYTVSSPVNSNYYGNNIVRISYGGRTYYELGRTPLDPADGLFGAANDNLTSAQTVKILRRPEGAQDDNLYISYRADGTCERIGTTLARCTKTYIQRLSTAAAPNPPSTMDHVSLYDFQLPFYADTAMNIVVKVNGVVSPMGPTTWSVNGNGIGFSNPITPGQKVEITYFVSNSSYVARLTNFRQAAQEQVNSICNCGTAACGLKPKYATDNVSIVDYECVYPTPTASTPPANQSVTVSGRNIPLRYYDADGVSFDEDQTAAGPQEGNLFQYLSGNVLRPNSATSTSPVGFNEIYGSFGQSGTFTARPPKVVRVKKDQVYDLFVNSGTFSTCTTCGNDYFSSLQKIFPQNFTGMGGGYTPNYVESSREDNRSIYRSDDLLYGRACFVPATMIPWTHVAGVDLKSQRGTRLAGQHFLFANGYSRDWFGFDYGSLIGSFDGVSWFAVGNARRIKAKSTKLFLAVNAYFGDLNTDNAFDVSISEITPFSPAISEHDTTNDGAECQRAHFCSTDDDCFRNLGYDYSCQNITGLMTEWPSFDTNATETVGTSVKSIAAIVGGFNGQAKRCVYRGRGAPCHANQATLAQSFNYSGTFTATSCSSNNYCQAISSSAAFFNDRIARAATTPIAQNTYNSTLTPSGPISDLAGLGARIIGRPFDYFGSKTIPNLAKRSLQDQKVSNKVEGVCIPGKQIAGASSTAQLNQNIPSLYLGSSDRINGVGPTMSGSGWDPNYLSACPVVVKSSTNTQVPGPFLFSDPSFKNAVIAQNISTNHLNQSSSTLPALLMQSGSQVTGIGLAPNACLRAPGASCFSDFECAPSGFIASRVRGMTSISSMNSAEKKYWEEELICSNSEFKLVNSGANPNYNNKENVCCREFGKTLTVFTDTPASIATSPVKWCKAAPSTEVQVANINTAVSTSSPTHYSRVHTAYDKITCDPSSVSANRTFALSTNATSFQDAWRQIQYQFKTLDTINERTCCTKNWIRSFAASNGGGHRWDDTRLQSIDKTIFKSMNWKPNIISSSLPPANNTPFQCSPGNSTAQNCEIRSFLDEETKLYSNFMGSLELTGIPQVAIPSSDLVSVPVDESFQTLVTNTPLKDTVPTTGGDFLNGSNQRYFSAANPALFTPTMSPGKLKKVFSDSEFNCCIPTNRELPNSITRDQCCTGYIGNTGESNLRRCCLPDYTNVSVYLNRYVSSEGRGLPDSAYDPATGFINDPGLVELLITQRRLCCSGRFARGVAISRLPIPVGGGNYEIPVNESTTSIRFVDGDDAVNDNNATTPGTIASQYNRGLRWNTHVYCVP